MPAVRLGSLAIVVGLFLPIAGLVFLLRPDYAAVHWTSPAMHFVFFLVVGFTAASLSLVTGEAARTGRACGWASTADPSSCRRWAAAGTSSTPRSATP